MDARDAESYLYALPRFADGSSAAYRPGLERIKELLEGMGQPQEAFNSILVGGTNGKGSTASLLAAIGTSSGRRVGLHTSPHLRHVAERMRIDGTPAPENRIWQSVARFHELAERVKPSFFELTVALSLLYFAEEHVDVAVVEVGMGGRLDATNILRPVLCAVTDIGLDHTQYLGTTIEAIAREKAGIIKRGVPVVTSARAEARRILKSRAAELASDYHDAEADVAYMHPTPGLRGTRVTACSPVRRYDDLYVGLAGTHQLRNARLALRAAELVYDGVQKRPDAVFDGMRRVRQLSGLRGRIDVLHEKPLIVADVAHNPDGLAAVLRHLRSVDALRGRLRVLFGVMRDKDVDAMLEILAAAEAIVHPVALSSERALTPEELDSRLRVVSVGSARPCTVREGMQAFLATADPADTLLLTGSHLVVAALESA